jgi:hypothetical protein
VRVLMIALLAGLMASLSLADTNHPVSWAELGLPGKTLVLMDGQKVERYRLLEGGAVAVSMGVTSGPLAAPLWFWRLEKDQLVIADSPQTTPQEALRLLRVDGRVLHVSRKSGASAQFRLTATQP